GHAHRTPAIAVMLPGPLFALMQVLPSQPEPSAACLRPLQQTLLPNAHSYSLATITDLVYRTSGDMPPLVLTVGFTFPRNKNTALPVRAQKAPLTLSGLKKDGSCGTFSYELSRPKRVS